jgi:hypothetical protein
VTEYGAGARVHPVMDNANDPIEFLYPTERKRWLGIYDRQFDRSGDPELASRIASQDMVVRRRALPPIEGRIPYDQLVTIAREAMGKVRDQEVSIMMQRPPSSQSRRALTEIDGVIKRLEACSPDEE